MLSIACLSQKGGVGKSTLARLIATTYSAAGWQVKIADFNTKQKTSVDWAAKRMSAGVEPHVNAAPYDNLARAQRDGLGLDLLVFDGKPDSDAAMLALALAADLVVIPTGPGEDDLIPQMRFAGELKRGGVPATKIVFVLTRTDSQVWIDAARVALADLGWPTAATDLPHRTGYMAAQSQGFSVSETAYPTLNEKAAALAQEIVQRLSTLTA